MRFPKSEIRPPKLNFLSLLISAIILSVVGIYNGYPLFYSDTNAYILSGMHLDTPTTRPITYGLFILVTSVGGWSLWPVIFIQSLMTAFLVYCCVVYLLKWQSNAAVTTLIISALLAISTGVSWVSSELIADIFTPLTIISLILLITVKGLTRVHMILLFFIFFLSNATHISHMAISVAVIGMAFLFKKRLLLDRSQFKWRIGLCLLLMVIGYFAMSSSVAKSRHIFVMAHLNEIGVLKPYLDEQCPTQNFKICKYKEEIPVDFIWDKEQSPVYRSDIGWRESQPEFDKIIAGILTTPKYLGKVISTSLKWTLYQLNAFRVGNGNNPFTEESEMYTSISTFFPNEAHTFLHSRQNKGKLLPVSLLDQLHRMVMFCSILILGSFLTIQRFRANLSQELQMMTVLVCISILVNALVCVSIVSVVDRFGCRVMWMFTLLAILYIISLKPASNSDAISTGQTVAQ